LRNVGNSASTARAESASSRLGTHPRFDPMAKTVRRTPPDRGCCNRATVMSRRPKEQRMLPRSTGYLDGDGERLYWETIGPAAGAGDAETVVLCHGLGGNGAVWFQQVPGLAGAGYRVVVWDQRGFGRSTDRAGRTGPVTAVDDLARLLDHLGVTAAHLVGQSMGGWAALGLAARAPARARSVVLSASTGGLPLPAAAAAGRPPVSDAPVARPLGEHPSLSPSLAERDPARAYLYQLLGSFGGSRSDAEMSAALASTAQDAAALRRLDVPVLLLCCEHDPLFPPALVRACAPILPRASVVELDGLGHSPYFENPLRWNAEVLGFLAAADGRDDAAQ
jgi:pimeloyl-ACP methyl ester carboxylesterase